MQRIDRRCAKAAARIGSVVDLARIERNIAEQRDDLSWGPNATFKFPKHGGTGAIYEGIADGFRERIHLNHEMQSIDLDCKSQWQS